MKKGIVFIYRNIVIGIIEYIYFTNNHTECYINKRKTKTEFSFEYRRKV